MVLRVQLPPAGRPGRAANGLHVPVVVFEEAILDGRNRYRACNEAGVDPHFRTYEGDDPRGFVRSLNSERRDLTASQRAVIALKEEEIEAAPAKELMLAQGAILLLG
jgi:hypothetical protein